MRKRMTILGLAALCAVAVSAVAAQGAWAGATAFTCVEGQGGANTNNHCVPGSKGNFGHVEIKADETTQLTLAALEKWKLNGNVFGAEVELEANGVECVECTVHNHTEGTDMEFTGTGRLRFNGVSLPKMIENCRVTSDGPVSTGAEGVIETETIKFTTKSPTHLVIEPDTETALAHFNITTAPGAHLKKCNLVGTHTITGDITFTLSGATGVVNITKAQKTLFFDGEPASLVGQVTLSAGETNGAHDTIALTEA